MWYASARWIDFPQAPLRHHSGNDSPASQEMGRSDTDEEQLRKQFSLIALSIFPRRPTVLVIGT